MNFIILNGVMMILICNISVPNIDALLLATAQLLKFWLDRVDVRPIILAIPGGDAIYQTDEAPTA